MKMKKTIILFAMAAIAAVACNKENNTTPGVPVHGTPVKQINAVIEETKSGMEFVDNADKTLSTIETWWLQGDKIMVTDGETSSIYESASETQNSKTAASFTGSGSFELENGLWAISPATAAGAMSADGVNFIINDVLTQDPYGTYTEWSKNDIKGGYSSASLDENVPSINFRNLTAILRVNLKLAADNHINFYAGEQLEAVRITAVGNEAIAGTYKMPFSADVANISLVSGKSEITCEFPDETLLSSTDKVTAYIPVAPVSLTSLLVTIETTRHTIQRTIAINTTLERNNFYNINLTKISGNSPYTVVTDVPIPGGGREDYVDENSTAGAVIALFDGVYDHQNARRYYTVQLAKDQNFNNIVLTTNMQITYTTIYSVGGQDDVLLSDGKVTFCGLDPSTRYYYRVKVMGVGDQYYSEPNTFVTKARKYKWEDSERFIDFDDVKCYGKGDAIGHAVATFAGATPVTSSSSTIEAEWNKRLGFVESDWATTSDEYKYWNSLDEPAAANTHAYWNAFTAKAACYRVGSDLGAAAVNSSNPFTSSIQGIESQSYCYNRPGYIELGKKDGNKGKIVIKTREVSNTSRQRIGHVITFKACTYDSDVNATLNFSLTSTSSLGITDTGEANVTIAGGRAHQWQNYTVTVIASDTKRYGVKGVLTITTDGSTKVLLDEIHITRATGY